MKSFGVHSTNEFKNLLFSLKLRTLIETNPGFS